MTYDSIPKVELTWRSGRGQLPRIKEPRMRDAGCAHERENQNAFVPNASPEQTLELSLKENKTHSIKKLVSFEASHAYYNSPLLSE